MVCLTCWATDSRFFLLGWWTVSFPWSTRWTLLRCWTVCDWAEWSNVTSRWLTVSVMKWMLATASSSTSCTPCSTTGSPTLNGLPADARTLSDRIRQRSARRWQRNSNRRFTVQAVRFFWNITRSITALRSRTSVSLCCWTGLVEIFFICFLMILVNIFCIVLCNQVEEKMPGQEDETVLICLVPAILPEPSSLNFRT